MNLSKQHLFAHLLLSLLSARLNAQVPTFGVETMSRFIYPGSRKDDEAAIRVTAAEKKKFPDAAVTVDSRLTAEPYARVVEYYRSLCKSPGTEGNDYCRFEFSRINDQTASRIEIYPAEIAKLVHDRRPTRINLIFVQGAAAVSVVSAKEEEILRMLKKRLGVYCYPNAIPVEKYAERERKTLDPDTEVYVLDTTDDFDRVHQHFRRLAGPFYVRMSMDGNIWMRDFEIDISRALAPEEFDKKVVLMVEENPIVPNARGALRPLRGHVFMTYYIWKRSPEELKALRNQAEQESVPENP